MKVVASEILGSAGSLPVLFGSLPKSFHAHSNSYRSRGVIGKLLTTTGW